MEFARKGETNLTMVERDRAMQITALQAERCLKKESKNG